MLFRRRDGRDAFEREAERVYPSMLGVAYRLARSRDEAEDLVQEALVRGYEAYSKFDGNNFKGWILRILFNQYINRYRQKTRGPQISSLSEDGVVEPMGDEQSIPDRALLNDMVGAEVENALLAIPEDFRIAVVLSDIEQMPYNEIAEITGVPVGTVRSRIARGRAALRKRLEQYAQQEGFI